MWFNLAQESSQIGFVNKDGGRSDMGGSLELHTQEKSQFWCHKKNNPLLLAKLIIDRYIWRETVNIFCCHL